ncbi:hypothetical protein ABBQ38_000421 [Trebouxia sp. C0009 RCD-2024]
MTVSFGRNAERFTWSVFLVLCNRIVTTTLAAGILSAQRQPLAPAAPIRSYAAVSFSNVIATSCQYEALKYVAFPVQTLGKCAKMIPVMIWGTLISRKVYSAKDYTVALLVTAGCTGFLFSRGAGYGSSKATSLPGGVLMLTYLAFDGFTSTFQDKLFKGYQMSVFNQMLYVNLCSALASFAGQVLIMHTIRCFGALAFATIMTSRQFVSVLASCLIFAHPLSLGQWCSTAVVFGGLYYKAFSKAASSRSSKTS